MADFVAIPKYRTFNNKRYTLMDAFVAEDTAGRLKARYKRQGYSVRVVQKVGAVHFLTRYHVYARRGK